MTEDPRQVELRLNFNVPTEVESLVAIIKSELHAGLNASTVETHISQRLNECIKERCNGLSSDQRNEVRAEVVARLKLLVGGDTFEAGNYL